MAELFKLIHGQALQDGIDLVVGKNGISHLLQSDLEHLQTNTLLQA